MSEGKDTTVVLSLKDFRELVSGRIVNKETGRGQIKIALSDIGWEVMASEVAKAAHESGHAHEAISPIMSGKAAAHESGQR